MNFLNRTPITDRFVRMVDTYSGCIEVPTNSAAIRVPKDDLPVIAFKYDHDLNDLCELFEPNYITLSFDKQRRRYGIYKKWIEDTAGLGYPRPAPIPETISVSRRIASGDFNCCGGHVTCQPAKKLGNYQFRLVWDKKSKAFFKVSDLLAIYHENIEKMIKFKPTQIINDYVESDLLDMYLMTEDDVAVVSDPLYNLLVGTKTNEIESRDIENVLIGILKKMLCCEKNEFVPGYNRFLSIGCFSVIREEQLVNYCKTPAQHKICFSLHTGMYPFTLVAIPTQEKQVQYLPHAFSTRNTIAKLNHFDFPNTTPQEEFQLLMGLYKEARLQPPIGFEIDKPFSRELKEYIEAHPIVYDYIGWTDRQETGGLIVASVLNIDEFKSYRGLGDEFLLYVGYDACKNGLLNYLRTHYRDMEIWKKVDASYSYGIPVLISSPRALDNSAELSENDYACLNAHYKRFLIYSWIEHGTILPVEAVKTYTIEDSGLKFPISFNLDRLLPMLYGRISFYQSNKRVDWEDGSTTIFGVDSQGQSAWFVDYFKDYHLVISGCIAHFLGFSGPVIYKYPNNPPSFFLQSKFMRAEYPDATVDQIPDILAAIHYCHGEPDLFELDALDIRNQIRARHLTVTYQPESRLFRVSPAKGITKYTRKYVEPLLERRFVLPEDRMESNLRSLPLENTYSDYLTGKRCLNPAFADIRNYSIHK